MANCSEFLDQLSDYVDGLLDRRTTRKLEIHLRHCGRCRETLTALRAGVGELQDADDVAPSPFFRQRLAARLEKEVRIGDPIQPTSAGLAAALLIGTALGLSLMGPLFGRSDDVPVVAERPDRNDPFASAGLTAVQSREPGYVPWILPDVTPSFTHRPPLFSSDPRPAGTLALLAR